MRERISEGSVVSKITAGIKAHLRKLGAFIKRHKIISVFIALVLILAIIFLCVGKKGKSRGEIAMSEASAVRMNISETISGSSIVEANDKLSKLEKELARVNGMLSNERFISKAPEAKINEEKAKLEKYTQMMEQVKERLAGLRK